MAQKLHTKNNKSGRFALLCLLCFFAPAWLIAQTIDSSVMLKKIIVTPSRKVNTFKNNIPAQLLDEKIIRQINAQSVGDAVRYFSGVLVKDYGGVGGLKTISVRSLGAANSGIIYDGIPVSDVQSGQIDLSRFSSTFIKSIQLSQANPSDPLMPARSFASASVLEINTNTFRPVNFTQTKWQAGLKAGSFGLWQPFAGILFPVGNKSIISANVESVFSKGNYPLYIDNGSFSKKTKRINSEIQSLQGEINFVKQFDDSSYLQTKIWGYSSRRGLPGAIIFFNERSAQQLWNEDVFAQTQYRKQLNNTTRILVSAKYSHTYTRYTDPDFLNGQGGLDSRYNQQKVYASAAITKTIGDHFEGSFASDISHSDLKANSKNFVYPSRLGLWNSLSAKYSGINWQLSGSILFVHFNDRTRTGNSSSDKNKITPTVALSFKPQPDGPLLLRFFYKEIFRMPTFNDLYYNFIGNSKLRPESARQFNLGSSYSKTFDGRLRQINISADMYYNSIDDKIIAVPNQNLFTWTMLNVGEVHIKGLDINAEVNGKISETINGFARIA
ncbi:MAG: TonB-dependent receptor, partial [Ginsengibacter sp.]